MSNFKLDRRTLLAATVPAVAALSAKPVQASPAAPVQLTSVWGMLDEIRVKKFEDTIFEKPSVANCVSDEGHSIMRVEKPRRVVVPMAHWPVLSPLTETRDRMDRINAAFDFMIWDMPATTTTDFHSQVKDADRVCRRPPAPCKEGHRPGPELYCFSKGPAGYYLTDDQGRQGIVVFQDRLRVVVVDGMPFA